MLSENQPLPVRRTVTDQDTAFLAELFADSRPELAILPEPARGQLLRMQDGAQRAQYRANFPDAVEQLIEVADLPAGRCWLARTAGADHLLDITVLSGLRGRGIGAAVIEQLCDEAGTRPIRLHVWAANAGAIRLYQRLGFTVDDDDHNGYLAMSRHSNVGASP